MKCIVRARGETHARARANTVAHVLNTYNNGDEGATSLFILQTVNSNVDLLINTAH